MDMISSSSLLMPFLLQDTLRCQIPRIRIFLVTGDHESGRKLLCLICLRLYTGLFFTLSKKLAEVIIPFQMLIKRTPSTIILKNLKSMISKYLKCAVGIQKI
eukprot:NODE_484_length_6933_cov_0.508341.p9 type:complete len:102 gc:universal NODE_484_length_6933_cov_0.508341:500-805(+)